jgi:RimJ/RimL family protein N-acetyltransferase
MLKIRPIEERDLERLLEIINQPSVIRYMPLERPVKMEKVRKWYESSIVFKNPTIFVLELGRVIGACSISENGKITVWIEEGEQGKGYGTKAVEWLKDYAKKNNLSKLWLECFKDNRRALDFYRGLGFKDRGEKEELLLLEMEI